jgi:sugar-specific transcriptional regulator TrmB
MKFAAFIQHLTTLGYSEKEARVYLACLELGPSSVAAIAERAGVKRPTAYVLLEALSLRGLVKASDSGRKGEMVALHPKRILELLEEEKRQAELRHGIFSVILPKLHAALEGAELAMEEIAVPAMELAE